MRAYSLWAQVKYFHYAKEAEQSRLTTVKKDHFIYMIVKKNV